MSTSKRAWLYVIRMKRRSILLLIILTVLMAISMLGLGLYTASKQAVQELRGSLGGYFTIQMSAASEETQTAALSQTNEQLLQQVRTLENVRQYNGVDTYYLYTPDLQLQPGRYAGTGLTQESTPRFIGCTDTSLEENFLSSAFQLDAGRHITEADQNKALISKDVADANGLSLGDTFSAQVVDGLRGFPEHTYGMEVEYEIVGIYHTTRNTPFSAQTQESDIPENYILTDIAAAKALYAAKYPERRPEEFIYSSRLMLFLSDPERMQETVSALQQQPYAQWESFLISENSASYQQAAAPIEKAGKISLFLLLVTLLLSVGIVTLILLLWTRERMPEIGILVSLGVSKKQICLQMLIENYILMIAAFLAAFVLELPLSRSLGGLLGQTAEQLFAARFFYPVQTVLVLLAAAVVILAAVWISSALALRKNPREILIDRS